MRKLREIFHSNSIPAIHNEMKSSACLSVCRKGTFNQLRLRKNQLGVSEWWFLEAKWEKKCVNTYKMRSTTRYDSKKFVIQYKIVLKRIDFEPNSVRIWRNSLNNQRPLVITFHNLRISCWFFKTVQKSASYRLLTFWTVESLHQRMRKLWSGVNRGRWFF